MNTLAFGFCKPIGMSWIVQRILANPLLSREAKPRRKALDQVHSPVQGTCVTLQVAVISAGVALALPHTWPFSSGVDTRPTEITSL